jgi:hypothetical protein
MAADIEKRMDLPILGTNEQQRFVGKGIGEIIAGACNTIGMTDKQPVVTVNLLDFPREDVGVGVERLFQRPDGAASEKQFGKARLPWVDFL